MTTQTYKFKIGDRVTYKDLDMEYYSRGYGINYETKTGVIVGISYKLSNGEVVEEKKLIKPETSMVSRVTPETSQISESTQEISLSETQTPPSNGQ